MPDAERQRSYVYTLALTNGTYYVGSCRGPHPCCIDYRLQEHFRKEYGFASQWTARSGIAGLVSVIDCHGACPLVTERAQTVLMMLKHGHLNVRGGPWTKVERKSPPEWWDPTMERSRRLYGTRPSPAETPSVPDRFEAPVSPTLSLASSQPLGKEG